MIVSLEAIFLSTFVMISQNRADAKRQVIADQQWQIVQEEDTQNEELLDLSKQILELDEGRPRLHEGARALRRGTNGQTLVRRRGGRARDCLQELSSIGNCNMGGATRTATSGAGGAAPAHGESGKPRPDRRRIATIAVGLVVAGTVFAYVLPRLADYGEVWGVIRSLSWWWILGLLGSAAVVIISDAPPWMTVLPGLNYFHALRMDLAGSAVSQVLPGGAAANAATQFGMLRSWGFEGRPVVLGMTLTTLWNQFVTFGFPVIAIGALSLEGGREKILGPVALAGFLIVALLVAALVAILWSPATAQRIGDHAAHLASRLKKARPQAARAVVGRRSRPLPLRGNRPAAQPLAGADDYNHR